MTTYVELFAGAGGLSLGLDRAGWHCAGHAEVEPHARAILRRHWPDTPLYGDVATLDGTAWRGINLLSGGSPCQDLSIAGKREGLSGRRSGLFHHQVRLWRESEAPILLWENVCGALSSHAGKDFARIISTILAEPVAVPRGRRRERVQWANAGYVEGTRGVALAWRVLDLRRFGVPQRRRRVFIVAVRGGVICPRDVLFDAESVRGDSDASQPSREANTGASVVGAGAGGAAVFDARGNGDGETCNTPTGDHQNRVTDYTAIVCPTITMGAHPAAPGLNGQDAQQFADAILRADPSLPRPRRLMPVECERLMSWPDQHTATGIDERGREYALKDTPRYKLCGNGVGSVVAEWIGLRILAALRTPRASG